METTSSTPARTGRVVWGRLLQTGAVAAVVAAAANGLVYLLASSLGAMPQDVDMNGQGQITLPLVFAMSAMGAVGGTLVYALLGRLVRRPVRLFRLVAALALLLSFGGPLTIAGAPAAMILTLMLMHVVAAGVVVGLLTTLAARR